MKLYYMYYDRSLYSEPGQFIGITKSATQAQQFVEEASKYSNPQIMIIEDFSMLFYYDVGIRHGNKEIAWCEIEGSSIDKKNYEHILFAPITKTIPGIDRVYVFADNENEAREKAIKLYDEYKL